MDISPTSALIDNLEIKVQLLQAICTKKDEIIDTMDGLIRTKERIIGCLHQRIELLEMRLAHSQNNNREPLVP